MPRFLRTVVPRIKRSLRERGVLTSMGRSFLLPIHLLQEYRRGRAIKPSPECSDFDREFGVDTDGDFEDRTYLSDLDIPSSNWIRGGDYVPIYPERLLGILSRISIRYEDFVFLDFGSGKGRALLIASHFAFRKIVGVEFSPQLHHVAEQNITRYHPSTQKCTKIQSVCMDFAEFTLPEEPCLIYMFDPCDEVVLRRTLRNLEESLRSHPRQILVIYVAPRLQAVMDWCGFLRKIMTSDEFQFSLYGNCEA